VLANQRITSPTSAKDVRHLELSLEGSGLRYQPGDALGLWPRNPLPLVQTVLAQLKLDGDTPVAHGGQERSLHDWLLGHRELTRLARPFLVAHAQRAPDLAPLLGPEQTEAFTALLANHQLPDLLLRFPGAWDAPALVSALRPLAPRLYSIASSQTAVGDEAHLTVDHLHWQGAGGVRWGAASHHLATSGEEDTVPVFIEANDRFRLPSDRHRDLIMIGPGTGVAPFRGFVQERVAVGASGRHWLFFGNPHARHDFLYQLEWQQALKAGHLHRLDLAFSRDQADKVYVQHRLQAQGRALFDWLENGAHLYVCGDASRMAADVEASLLAIISHQGGRDEDGARDYLAQLRQQGRYARDVY
jgi:sulfite reductase (NADPH) flavoprotein alpha-component